MIAIRLKFRTLILLLAGFLAAGWFYMPANAGEELFSVQRVGQMISNRENAFSVQAPENGIFTVTIRDDYYTYRILKTDVVKGTNRVVWDGCGYNSERLATQYYTFDFLLETENGQANTFSFRSPVVSNDPYLQFVLPSGKEAWLSVPKEWFIELKSVRDGTVFFEFTRSGEESPAFTAKKSAHAGRVERYTLEKLFGNRKTDPGEYAVTVYEETRRDTAVSFPLQLYGGFPPEEDVAVTGDIMPAGSDDDAVWGAMMKPAAVIASDFSKSVPVLAEPDKSAKSLGTFHGATQCVSVLEMRDGWARIGAWNHETADYTEGWIPSGQLKIMHPNTDYGLLVNKKQQTITVYYRGKPLETLLVSTGHMDRNKLIRETSAGMFLTGYHRVDFSMEGSKYDYVIQYDGGNLLHQIPYSSAGKKDFTWGKAYLGSKASHACIRIQDFPGPESGINAYWIWTHIPYHTKLIILDDPEEREKTKAILSGTAPAVNASGPAFLENPPGTEENAIVLTFGGNVIPGSREGYFYAKDSFCTAIEKNGASWPFSGLLEIFGNDDLTCVNLECTLKDDSSGGDMKRNDRLRGLPAYANMFAEGSVEMVCLANEHVYDYREEGFAATSAAVESGSEWIGYGRTAVIRIKGHLFGFGACTEEEYLKDPDVIARQIRSLRENGCEYVVYQCHWGNEKDEHAGKLQEAMARACERAGADLLVGHHPGKPQGIDMINAMPVAYSLGNLIPAAAPKQKSYDTYILQAVFYPERNEKTPELCLIPVLSSSSASESANDFRPVPAEGGDRTRILETIQQDTGFDLIGTNSQ